MREGRADKRFYLLWAKVESVWNGSRSVVCNVPAVIGPTRAESRPACAIDTAAYRGDGEAGQQGRPKR